MQFWESDEFCINNGTQDQNNTSVIVDHSQLVNLWLFALPEFWQNKHSPGGKGQPEIIFFKNIVCAAASKQNVNTPLRFFHWMLSIVSRDLVMWGVGSAWWCRGGCRPWSQCSPASPSASRPPPRPSETRTPRLTESRRPSSPAETSPPF